MKSIPCPTNWCTRDIHYNKKTGSQFCQGCKRIISNTVYASCWDWINNRWVWQPNPYLILTNNKPLDDRELP